MLEIVFVRDAARGDSDDTLSQEGEAQCLRAGEKLQERGFLPDLVVMSDDARCRRTAELIAQGLGGEQPRFAVVPGLRYFAPDQATYDAHIGPIFKELGTERPISEYLARDEEARRILLSRAGAVAGEILAEALGADGIKKVLIVGHHIMQNLIGIMLAGIAQVSKDSILLGPEFEHLEGYEIHGDKPVTKVKLVD